MIPPFSLHRPTTVAEASALMGELDDASFYSGGTELTLLLKMGLAQFRHLIDIKGIEELHGIAREDGTLRIGAASTHAQVEYSPLVQASAPGLAAMERWVANVRVRSTGTIGGNLCFAEPHSDPATFFIAWGADLELARGDARRRRPVEGFVTGALETDREVDELLVSILLPDLPAHTAVVHQRVQLVQRPVASVAVRLGVSDGGFSAVRVAVGSVGEIPLLIPEAAQAVEGVDIGDAARVFKESGRVAAAQSEPFEDLNGSVAYKRHLVSVLVRRGLEYALTEVQPHA